MYVGCVYVCGVWGGVYVCRMGVHAHSNMSAHTQLYIALTGLVGAERITSLGCAPLSCPNLTVQC